MKTRQLIISDDFGKVNNLVHETLVRLTNPQGIHIHYSETSDGFKSRYFSDDGLPLPGRIGFVAEDEGRIVAFMGVYVSELTKDGYISVGYEEGYVIILSVLLKLCCDTVKEQGGHKVCRSTTLLAGQVRNQEFAMWESMGFVADEYFHTLIKLDIGDWVETKIDTTGIQPDNDMSMDQVIRMLREDQDDFIADDFIAQYSTKTPDKVLLTMKQDTAIAGIAYYRLEKFSDIGDDGKPYDGLGAWAMGIHMRPTFNLSRSEKRRFVRAVISSMRQLGVIFVSSWVSSRDFDLLMELFGEGFYFQGQATTTVRLSLPV